MLFQNYPEILPSPRFLLLSSRLLFLPLAKIFRLFASVVWIRDGSLSFSR